MDWFRPCFQLFNVVLGVYISYIRSNTKSELNWKNGFFFSKIPLFFRKFRNFQQQNIFFSISVIFLHRHLLKTSNSISGIRRYKYWPTNCTPRILLFRSEIQSTDTQIKYKPPIVTTRLNRLSYFVVYIFQSLFTFFNICTQIFTLSR